MLEDIVYRSNIFRIAGILGLMSLKLLEHWIEHLGVWFEEELWLM